ncbi:MAG: NAD(P)-dependent oxidoreductase, partial [Alphaproteobacteria bacterium]|nr:NAD(P)-dependent oxidoreductase [Alphaproteobacteria bacterium]
ARLVQVCADIAATVDGPKARPRPPQPADDARYDVVLLGGTGFIGRHTLAALRAEGKRVAVFARSVDNLPAPFHDPAVGVFRGSIGDKAAVADMARRAPVIVNLAHGGGGASAAAVEAAMVGGARLVAEAALAAGCEHLVFVSSIAALYLGARDARITAATPPDPNHDRRADYARAKALAELAMLHMHRQQGLPVSILRPGVVLGLGTSPFHSGIGLYNRQTHCIGWNDGQNPLPLVLGEDVASAIAAAIRTPAAIGQTLNLVGDVRLSARDYTRELGYATGRPLVYHPSAPWTMQAEELLKWGIKRVAGRKVPVPSFADLKSRGLVSQFDCSAEKDLLGWQPEADRERFLQQAFATHGG